MSGVVGGAGPGESEVLPSPLRPLPLPASPRGQMPSPVCHLLFPEFKDGLFPSSPCVCLLKGPLTRLPTVPQSGGNA